MERFMNSIDYRLGESDCVTFAGLVLQTKTDLELETLIRDSTIAISKHKNKDFEFFKFLKTASLSTEKIDAYDYNLDFWLSGLGFEFQFGKPAITKYAKLLEDCILHIHDKNKSILYNYAVYCNIRTISKLGAEILLKHENTLGRTLENLYDENHNTIYGLGKYPDKITRVSLLNYTIVNGLTAAEYKKFKSNEYFSDAISKATIHILKFDFSESFKFALDSFVNAAGKDLYTLIISINGIKSFKYLEFENIKKIKGTINYLPSVKSTFVNQNPNPLVVDKFFDEGSTKKYLYSISSIFNVNDKFSLESIKFLNQHNIDIDSFRNDLVKVELRFITIYDWHPYTKEHKKFFGSQFNDVLTFFTERNKFDLGNIIEKIIEKPETYNDLQSSENQIDEISEILKDKEIRIFNGGFSLKVLEILLKKFKISKESILKYIDFLDFKIKP